MADVMGALDAVYDKWQKKATVNGTHRSQSSNSFNNVVEEGRKAWKTKFKELPPQPVRRSQSEKYNKRQSKTLYTPLSAILGEFKRNPSIRPQYGLYSRPATGSCCLCMPVSRDTFVHEIDGAMPMSTNVLRLPQLSCRHSALLSLFSNITYTYRHTVRFGYPNITESVLRSHRSQLAVEKTVQEWLDRQGLPLDENSKEYKKQKKNCDKQLKKLFKMMRAVMSIPIFKLTGWFLNTVLGSLLNAIQVQKAQIRSLKDASLSGKPVIYLPMHRSHLDYVLITYILWHYGIRAPYVAAGDNLNIFGFGHILRSLGGFFIRRRMDKEAGKKDHLYRAVLCEYVEELLRRGQSLEFFVEGGRSRSGKALYPKGGLLSIVVDWVLASKNETDGIFRLDALIVPVSISYEKIMDGNFTREQMGMPKKPESFWATVKAIWKLFSTTFGNVRVDFCQPFSLKEFLTVNKSSLMPTTRRADSPINLPGIAGLRDSMQNLQAAEEAEPMLPRTASDNSIYGIDVRKEGEKVVVDALARHVIYNSMSSAAVMSTHIVAFSLLTNYRAGVHLDELVTFIDELRRKILFSARDLGFVGSTRDIIAHACRLLGPHLVALEMNGAEATWSDVYEGEKSRIKLTPNLSLPHVIELSYYSAPVLSVFQLKSLIACAICATSGLPLLDSSVEDEYTETTFTRQTVIDQALYLSRLLKYEYLFTWPCMDLETKLSDEFESLIGDGLFESMGGEEGQQWTRRIGYSDVFGFGDEPEYFRETEYQLLEEGKDLFKMLTAILQPMVESYWVTGCKLERLLTNDEPFADLSKSILDSLISRVERGITDYPESVAQEMVKNSLHSLSDLGVVVYYDIASERMASLTDQYNSTDNLNELINKLDSYKSR